MDDYSLSCKHLSDNSRNIYASLRDGDRCTALEECNKAQDNLAQIRKWIIANAETRGL